MIFCQQWMVTAGLAKWKNKIKKKKVLKSTFRVTGKRNILWTNLVRVLCQDDKGPPRTLLKARSV